MEQRFNICLCQNTSIYNLHAYLNKGEIIGCWKITGELMSLFSVPVSITRRLWRVTSCFVITVSEHITAYLGDLGRLKNVSSTSSALVYL